MGMLLRRRFATEADETVEDETPTPPKRSAPKKEWLAYLGVDEDGRTRDEIADSVLGPKG